MIAGARGTARSEAREVVPETRGWGGFPRMSEKGDGWTGTAAARIPAALTRGIAPPRSRISACVAVVWHWTALSSHHHSLGIMFIEKVKSIIIKKENKQTNKKVKPGEKVRPEKWVWGRGSRAPRQVLASWLPPWHAQWAHLGP